MIQKSILYKKQLRKQIVKKKMKSIIFYGIIFLISTIAYYFVNTSKAQNVLKLEAFVLDKEAVVEQTSYQMKAEENGEVYKIKLPSIQNGFVVKKYYLISKEEYDELNKEQANNNIAEIEISDESEKKDAASENKETENILKQNIIQKQMSKQNIVIENTVSQNEVTQNVITENTETQNQNDKKNLATNQKNEEEKKNEETKKKEDIVILPETEFKLTSEEVQSKTLYFVAEYDKKQANGKDIYNKIISTKTEKNVIIISGYMPLNAKVKVTEVDAKEVENKIKDKTENNVKLQIAYDIKIIEDETEYEPNEFDENVKVRITTLEDENINVWHIKDDENIEKMQAEKIGKNIEFDTDYFSIYGVEIVGENKTDDSDANEITDEKANEIKSANDEQENIENKLQNEEVASIVEKIEPTKTKGAPRRAAASNLPDSTLEINDYVSDFNYYIGKNYTDDISGTNSNTYTSSNLVKVTVNYHGFAQGEIDPEKKGRISLTETDDIVKNIRCLPIINDNVSIELMDNPFMDKPTGYGFGGWMYNGAVVAKDANTKTQTLTIPAQGDITVNLYANWAQATVVYVNGETGSDNNLHNGLSEEQPFGSWERAFEYINSNNTGDRETNIIVVTGDLDSSINYSRPVNKSVSKPANVTYNSSTSITSGQTYILSTGTGVNGNAITASGTSITNTQLRNNVEPPDEAQWIITSSGNGYTIRNKATGYYLAYSSGLTLRSSSFTWSYNNRRFYYSTGGWWSSSYYIRYNNGWTTSTSQNQGTQFYFVTYTAQVDENAEDIISYTKGSLESNSYYSSSSNSIPVTVTSLYNHTDYRNNATITLNKSSSSLTSSADFNIYKDFQMNHVKISATGYKSCTTSNIDSTHPVLIGHVNNVRLGRGILSDSSTDATTFAGIIGGNETRGSTRNDDYAYKIAIESGKYSGCLGFSAYGGTTCSYYGTIYLTLGNDIDRSEKYKNNDNLSVYYRTTVSAVNGAINGKLDEREKAFLINVKSGKFGIDYCNDNGKENFSGIYVGAYVNGSSSSHDISDRYCIVEGGLIANLTGGLKTYTSNPDVNTKIYVKGGELYNIVGGAGVNETYNDRFIQVTGGTIRYSISGGSNGNSASSSTRNGKLTGKTLVYVGGNAQVGTQNTLGETLYGVSAGCVLGAGNGNEEWKDSGSGQVTTSHIIINDEAHILNRVYGGGNYGVVGTREGTTGTAKIEILGGTIDGNVFGGANLNNIYGSTSIDVKGGQVKGAVYGGSNTEGTISTTTTINVTGGTLGQSTNTTNNEVLFGGGYGQNTVVTGNATVNIFDTDANVNIYGSAYGGSSLGTMSANTIVNIQDSEINENTINIVGNVFAGGKGNNSRAAVVTGNATINVDGANIPNASIFGGNDLNGTTNGNITVNIGENYNTTVGNAYGGGNEDDTGTEADTVKVYLFSHANVTNAFNGGKSANLVTSGTNDTTRAIYLKGGYAENIFGGSDTDGEVTASHVYIESGTATNVYGGNNKGGQTAESFVYIQGATVTNVYGGGYLATTPTTNVSLTAGTITNGFGGGNAANVTTSNITLNGTTASNIYGGSNQQGTVSTSNVTITSGTVADVYGGNNAGGNTVNTNVVVTSTAQNVYGGGNEAITSGNTYVNLNNATIEKRPVEIDGETVLVGGNVFGGGNGSAAVVQGNSTTIVQGTTTIANDLFGGGNAAPNGTEGSLNSTVKTYITGGRIEGDVYGAANTSVVYGQTEVKIGADAVNNNTLAKNNIYIGGTVFGGGKSNTAGSASYDFDFESVTGDANIDIDANGYDNGTYTFTIRKSVFGSGNAAKISGEGYVNISNYGSNSNLKENISIQRATKVVLNNCKMYLVGTTDTTNEIATAVYTFNRIDDIVLKNNTTLYLESGVNIVSKLESLDNSNNKAQVRISENGITNRTVDNRIFLLEGKNVILKTEEGNHGEVYGMTYVGIFKSARDRIKGIYDIDTYREGTTIPAEVQEIFERNSYVQGKHYTSHNIEEDGFYTNYDNNGVVNTAYIVPTPEAAAYYQWIVGKVTTDIYYEDIELIGTKYATTGAYVLTLAGLSYPNTTIKVVDFDVSELKDGITLNEPGTIPNIAATGLDADTKFGLTMTAGNEGWQTKGTTNFLNNNQVQEGFSGTTEYLSDNSNTTPTFSFYLDHSKNISSTEVLGTVKISLEVNYVENEVMQIRNAYIIIKLSINNTLKMDKDFYEGAITPGKQYSMFPTTTTTITKKSSFSAYYSLYLNDYSKTKYYEGFAGKYYHVLISSCVLPAKTKITLIDKSKDSVKYYYYIVTSADETNEKTVFRFTDFKAMDSTEEPYSSDGVYYNNTTDLLYEEFIVHVDFEDITLSQTLEGQNLLVQLRDAFDDTPTITVNTAQYPMLFSVYNNLEANATITLTTDKRVIHMGDVVDMDIKTEYTFSKNDNLDTVYDTTNIDNQLGVRITISSGSKLMTSTDLEGIYIKYKNSNYYARSDGSYRIKIADAVANVLTDMELHTEVGNLETGTYTIKAESFGSTDGTYFSSAIAQDTKDLQIVSSKYGFVVNLDDNSVLIDKTTGKNKNDTNNLNFTIGYSGNFDTPKIVVSLYRRKYDQIYSYEYEQVDLSDYVTNNLTSTTNTNEYLVTSNLQESQNYTLTTKNNLTTGTYKIRFSLYDGDILIADMDKAVIIK